MGPNAGGFKQDLEIFLNEEVKLAALSVGYAESLGSKYKGRACGTFGRFGILSFNGNKIIITFGGGALVCHSQQDKDKVIFLSTQARDDAPHYRHSHIGYSNLSDDERERFAKVMIEVFSGKEEYSV
ncbi:DegT/DnrJ/EryC1/StrS aminotransferase family protein [Chryseobacterium sp. RU37D]|nr:DegT/DnrJ/EryC1/StrS aminotransferase family protein [Chryseobacterium sp. RU37D]